MDPTYALDTRAGLTMRWRNGLALAAGAIVLGFLEALLVLFGSLPGDGRLLIGALLGGVALVCGAGAFYFLSAVRREEARLERAGTPRRADRSLLGTIRRSFVTDATPVAALGTALTVLSDPGLGLIHVGRSLFGGVTAIRPAETGLIVIDVVPLAVGVRARSRDGRTEVTVSVVQSSVYGWPALSGWVGWSASYSWIDVAQTLADAVVEQLEGLLSGSAAPAGRTPLTLPTGP